MLGSFVLALAFGHLVAASEASPGSETQLFVKNGNGNDASYEPWKAFDYESWTPDNSLYKDVPMVEKHTVIDGKDFVYQDFDISALSLDQFKEHVMATSDFRDDQGNLVSSDQGAQAYQETLIASAVDANTSIALPSHIDKRAFPDGCFYDSRLHCNSACTKLISRGVRQSINSNVYGYYHYQSGSLCGTGSITKTVSVTHVSGVTIGGSGQIPGFGKGWTKVLSTFFSTFGLTISHTPDSVTTAISYAGTCGPFNVCFLWERPHFSVDKGVVVTQHIDVNTNKACSNPTVTPYEAHVVHTESDPGGATANGICYSMANHGCGRRVAASSTLQRCPNNY
ncbi:uncharacterized protein CTRU02_200819 [Colletotrichum truncatum]|uniref:Uncharacterized protein n=1 Tax=Colletotrichum truncatum TaxID=5467 RepID=A0ACC3ZG81_COLTU|nr:uncharacterized protein CTRU02_00587 [Colletotrichum truncatum]KAF6801838.1 hypothetical protein CTRU02_00587 [Colletotrichum truncatum]